MKAAPWTPLAKVVRAARCSVGIVKAMPTLLDFVQRRLAVPRLDPDVPSAAAMATSQGRVLHRAAAHIHNQRAAKAKAAKARAKAAKARDGAKAKVQVTSTWAKGEREYPGLTCGLDIQDI